MPSAFQRTLAVPALFLLIAGVARATTFVGVNERTLARAADAIVIGTVERIETVGGSDGSIDPLGTVDVKRTYKGDVGRRVTLKQPGGRLGGRLLWIAGSPRLRVGDHQLLLLSAHRDGPARTPAFGMGQFSLRRHPRTGKLLAERRVDGLVLGDRPLRRVPLARLLAVIGRTLADDPGVAAPLVSMPPELVDPGL